MGALVQLRLAQRSWQATETYPEQCLLRLVNLALNLAEGVDCEGLLRRGVTMAVLAARHAGDGCDPHRKRALVADFVNEPDPAYWLHPRAILWQVPIRKAGSQLHVAPVLKGK